MMKSLNIGLVILLFAVTLISCSVSREARSMKKNINGDWVLQTMTTEGITGVAKTKIFNEAEFKCFVGSDWNFIANNSMGSYTLVDRDKGCAPVERLIRWSIYEPKGQAKEFQFKRLDNKKNSMDNGDGFRLTIMQLDKTQMKLKSEMVFSGQAGAVIYNFIKK